MDSRVGCTARHPGSTGPPSSPNSWRRWHETTPERPSGGYSFLAVATRVAEAFGARKCGCAQDCWCRRPSLSAFRWVFPCPHRDAHQPDEAPHLGSLDRLTPKQPHRNVRTSVRVQAVNGMREPPRSDRRALKIGEHAGQTEFSTLGVVGPIGVILVLVLPQCCPCRMASRVGHQISIDSGRFEGASPRLSGCRA